ncbi:MAG TPA: hypothetical protein VIQ53_26835, partial [Inquilinus sp.]
MRWLAAARNTAAEDTPGSRCRWRIQAQGDLGNGWLEAHSAGTGPYAVQRWMPNERVVLDGNPHWQGSGGQAARHSASFRV